MTPSLFTLWVATLAAGCGAQDKTAVAVADSAVGAAGKTVSTVLSQAQPQFFDEPQFTVAGVTDNTYRGGHGSDAVLRSSETLTKATASLSDESPHDSGDPLQTVQALQKAAETDPSEGNIFAWGTELLSHHAPDVAARVFDSGARKYPTSQRMLLGLAVSWYAAGFYDKAAHCFFEAADLNPDSITPYTFLSQVKAPQILDNPEYHEQFAKFVRRHPENPLANYYFGKSVENEPDRALPYLQRAVVLDSNLTDAYLQLGAVLLKQGQYPAAIAALQTAIRQKPDLEEAHYRLAEAYRVTGERAKAADELARYNELSKQSAAAVEHERSEVQTFVIQLKKAAN